VIRLWTDGCCLKAPGRLDGPGGWALVVEEDGEVIHTEVEGHDLTTPLRMELHGVIAALRYARGRRLEVCCDAKVVVDCVMEGHVQRWKHRNWTKAPGGEEEVPLWRRIEELLYGSLTTLTWVRGHSGLPFNELADELADVAARGARTATRWDRRPFPEVVAAAYAAGRYPGRLPAVQSTPE